MKENKRFFSSRQRIILFLYSGGFCRICGIELEPGWHSDHIQAFSKGGVTEVYNGQSLCPICNLQKSNKEIEITQIED